MTLMGTLFGMEELDLDGRGPALDPVDDWRDLNHEELAAALEARGARYPAIDAVVANRFSEATAARLDRYFADETGS
jgi:hypothetical protein